MGKTRRGDTLMNEHCCFDCYHCDLEVEICLYKDIELHNIDETCIYFEHSAYNRSLEKTKGEGTFEVLKKGVNA
jgi:hypothetical protein